MFKTAATKIAHNSTIPALAGNKDLRPLQDLITAEKSVLIATQKLSVEFGKAAEALRIWGSGEGEDLLDTLSASTNLLSQFSTSLANYASHEHAIRDHMKSIRSREEALDELKRKRKALISKADAAEKKLSKMSPEHKNLHAQTDTLKRLLDDIRTMDSEIMSDEASLGDFKRSKTKAWMGLKFGGLLECSEKGSIIGEFGRLVIAEIPEETTQPGMARAMYMNHGKVNSILTDASRCVAEVSFSTVPPPGSAPPAPKNDFLGPTQGFGTGHFLDASEMSTNMGSANMGSANMGSGIPPSPISPNNYSYQEASRSTEEFGMGSPTSPIGSRYATFPASTNATATFPASPNGTGTFPANTNTTGAFPVSPSATGTFPVSTNTTGTFPASTNMTGYALHDGPTPSVGFGEGEDSFSSSVAAALDARQSFDEPAPSYETHQAHLPGPPAGAALPVMMPSPWDTDHNRLSTYSEDVGLAYMNPSQEDVSAAQGRSRPTSREVHFGQVSDIDTEMNRRQEQEDGGGISPSGARMSQKRIPPPSLSPEEEERALNAAAARELGRELESLSISPPSSSAPPPPRLEISHEGGRDRSSSFGSMNNSASASPLIPPVAPFAQRGSSPGPIETNVQYDDTEKSLSPTRNSPPRMTLPDRTSSSATSIGSYRTPPEYPRSIGSSPFGQRSTSSLTGGISPSPAQPGAPRTISAAAFRRPATNNRSASNDFGSGGGTTGLRSSSPLVDTSPLQPRKRGAVSSLSQSNTPEIPYMEPSGANRVSQAGSDDHYDYISAYTDAPPAPGSGSPQRSDFGSLGQMRVANDSGVPPSPGTPGYGEGRFATNLEGELR
ncbi:hypothetical protein GYMLUDRAFT_264655 [Collybiopsis luxurians FD-317 M1]|uniref:Unplaced genomic scaffold GYMLUscaffold_68, whole genome shotgun sequence n=1 Tax=Collybiopsis luxurians FD-317 M1 TaxID=944289 RepID=A0A0D0C8V4_9AGAR|nr:hypothetical protein GYMLUDRAFT_264655 [Collybiopsis luxurians FD-317 M1]